MSSSSQRNNHITIKTAQKNRILHIPKSSLVARHRAFLRQLNQASKDPAQIKKLLKKASTSQINSVAEISLNLLRGSYPHTTRKYLARLKSSKNLLRKLACCQTTSQQKRRLLLEKNTQTGGLPFLVPLLAPIVGQLIATGISAAL